MICSHCGNSQKAKEGMTCQKCKKDFVFDPKTESPKITDSRWMKLVKKASGDGEFYFTLPQVLAASRPGPLSWVGPILLTLVVMVLSLVFFASRAPWPIIAFFFAIVSLIGMAIVWPKKMPYEIQDIERFAARWEEKNGRLEKLIRIPRLSEPPPGWDTEDTFDYGVERVVIVQREILVDWLVLNGWHAENRALVLSRSGYPAYLVPKMQSLVAADPKMKIFLLHDATPEGERMLEDIMRRSPLGLKDVRHQIIDLGARHEDTKKIKGLKAYHRTPSLRDQGIPLDALPYGLFLAVLAVCMKHNLAISAILQGAEAGDAEALDFGDFG